jgi:hypothetical protein
VYGYARLNASYDIEEDISEPPCWFLALRVQLVP